MVVEQKQCTRKSCGMPANRMLAHTDSKGAKWFCTRHAEEELTKRRKSDG